MSINTFAIGMMSDEPAMTAGADSCRYRRAVLTAARGLAVLNAALYGKQTFVNGAAQAKNFNASRMIRLGEMPQVVVKLMPQPALLDRGQVMGGVGELGVPTLAPALANA